MKKTTHTLLLYAALGAAAVAAPRVDDLADSDVLNALESEYILDAAVPSHRIDVEIENGIVSLEGSVTNLRAKDRATRIAETVKGVRSVVNRIAVEPKGDLTDTQVRASVNAALLSDPATDSYEVTVTVNDGHAVLSGSVDSWRERELCATVAKGVSGVRELTNDILVSYSTERSDAEIEAEIEQSLRWDVLVDHALIDVAVSDGTVRLDGTVGSAAEKRRARTDAWVGGVSTVDDSGLEVARWARDDDLRESKYVIESPQEVRRALVSALAIDPRVYSFNVDPTVENGVVTLRGVVDDLKAKRAAEQDARSTVGVLSVRNHLKVRPVEERPDDEIEKDVQAAFLRDPDVDRYALTVTAEDGTVYLHGTVDSYFEKAQADDLASRVSGVTDVRNRLVVDAHPYSYDPYVDDWYAYDYPWYSLPLVYAPMSDDVEIEREIEDQLFWSPFVDADQVAVSVEDGVATLTGTVDSWQERGAARDNAYDGGASYVRNELVVGSSR